MKSQKTIITGVIKLLKKKIEVDLDIILTEREMIKTLEQKLKQL